MALNTVMHWTYKGKEITKIPEDIVGFVYLITNKTNDMKNKTDTVWAVMCPAWGTVISLYSTKELADVAASIMKDETAITKKANGMCLKYASADVFPNPLDELYLKLTWSYSSLK